MSIEKSHVDVLKGSDRNFGIVFSIVFLIVGLLPLFTGQSVRVWSFVIAIALLAIAIIRPRRLAALNTWWFRFGLALGAIVAPVVLFVVFCLTVVPLGFIMRLLGKDLLCLKLNKNATSYWVTRESEAHESMKNQF